ncbi:MAG: hypothetical protein U0Q15_15870 [Kineosporiaceae bacterium]
MAQGCAGCGRGLSGVRTFRTATGRVLCPACWEQHVALAAAGGSLASGGSTADAVVAGTGARQWAQAVADDAEAAIARRAKVAAAQGRWGKLKAWLIG